MMATKIHDYDNDFSDLHAFRPRLPAAATDLSRYVDLGDSVADPAALSAIDTSTFLAAKVRLARVASLERIFSFSPTSAAAANGISVIAPNVGLGRWLAIGVDGGLLRQPNIAGLAAIDCTGFTASQAHICEVLTVGDFFKHSPTGSLGRWSNATAYAVGDIVFRTSLSYVCIQAHTNQDPAGAPTAYWLIDMTRVACDAVGQTHLWERMRVANPTYKSKQFWAVDPAAGSDENQGWGTSRANALLAPLKTVAEFTRRVAPIVYRVELDLYIASDVPDTDDVTMAGISAAGEQFLNCTGARPVLYGPSTITAIQIPGTTLPTVNNDWAITDSALAGTWTNSGPGGSSLVSTAARPMLMEKTTGNVRGWIMKDNGSKTCRVGQPFATSGAVGNFSSARAAFANGDTYQISTVTRWPRIHVEYQFWVFRNFYIPNNVLLGEIRAYVCAFTSAFAGFEQDLTAIGCALINSGTRTTSGRILMANNVLIGGTLLVSGRVSSDTVNTFQNCVVNPNHGAQCEEFGTLVVFDCTTPFLNLNNLSFVGLANIRGKDNSGYILQITGAGCRVVCAPIGTTPAAGLVVGLTAITSKTHPIEMGFSVSTELDYDEVPFKDDTYESGILGT